MNGDERTCEQCGRLLTEPGLMLGDWSRITNAIHVSLPGTFPRVHLSVALPRPMEFCGDECATNWLAQAIDEKHCRDNDDRLAQAEADAAERARDADAELVDERCTWVYQTAAVPA